MEGGTPEDLIAFADRAELSDWATESAAAVAKAGYVKGELNPKEKIKRKEKEITFELEMLPNHEYFYRLVDGSDSDTSSNRIIGELELYGDDTDQEYVLIVKVMAAESGRENSPITVVKIKFKAKK